MNPKLSIQSIPDKTKQAIIDEISEIRGKSEVFSRTVIENAVKANPGKYPELLNLVSQHPARKKDTFWITAFMNHSGRFKLWNSKYCKVPVWKYIGQPHEAEA